MTNEAEKDDYHNLHEEERKRLNLSKEAFKGYLLGLVQGRREAEQEAYQFPNPSYLEKARMEVEERARQQQRTLGIVHPRPYSPRDPFDI